MPNEKVNDYVSQGWYTEVSWRRRPGLDSDDQGSASGHVQLATVNALSPFHFPDIDTGDHFEAGKKFDGWRVTLDEAGIDHLIRTLHKAKRQAFGEPKPEIKPPNSWRVIGDDQVAAAEYVPYIPETARSYRIAEHIANMSGPDAGQAS